MGVLRANDAALHSNVLSSRKRPAASRMRLNSIQNAWTSMNNSLWTCSSRCEGRRASRRRHGHCNKHLQVFCTRRREREAYRAPGVGGRKVRKVRTSRTGTRRERNVQERNWEGCMRRG
eukprot:754059-Hanusia_phi.AAC.3